MRREGIFCRVRTVVALTRKSLCNLHLLNSIHVSLTREMTELIGLVGGFTSISAALPQIYKCVLTGKTRDLSYVTNAISYVGSSISVYYGVCIGHTAIIACSLYAILVNTALLATKIYFESDTKYAHLGGDDHI